MVPTLVFVVVGLAFVLLGRWLYRNPTKLMPSWGFFNPENPSVKKVARAYSVFLIFFGAFALTGIVIVRLLPWALILTLPIAAVGAWFLRPRPDEPALDALQPISSPAEIPEKQPLLSKHWKRGLVVIGILAISGIVLVMQTMANSDASRMAFAAAQASPVIKQRLGEPIKRGLSTSGSIEISGPSGHADISFPIRGPRGTATLYAVARKSADVWKFDTLQAGFGDEKERLDLLKHD